MEKVEKGLPIAGILCGVGAVACGLGYLYGGLGVKGNLAYLLMALGLTCAVVLILMIFLGGLKPPRLQSLVPGMPSVPSNSCKNAEPAVKQISFYQGDSVS